jgi:DNA polymerase III, subunit gamma and tau
MASESLYRKWRSQTFSDMVGQEPVIRTLKNALRSGKLAHAYLFTGPRGTGKTSTARLLAKTINCQNPQDGEPCNVCDQCREITNGSSFNVNEIDAASNRGIDSIRELREKVMVPPTTGKYKVYILDEAHMLTTEAFNALLKTLEEPPPHAIFVLATTDVHKMLPTVLSRCQRFEFKRFTLRQLVDHLQYVAQQEHVELQAGSAELIARAASGGMRDALSLLDQAIAYAGNVIALPQVQTMLGVADPRAIQNFIVHIADLDSPAGLHLINDLSEAGADLRQLNTQIAEYWRAMMLGKAGANVGEILENTEDEIKEILELAQRFTLPELTECARIFAQNELLQKSQATPQLGLELALLNCMEIHRQAQAGPPVGGTAVSQAPARVSGSGAAPGYATSPAPQMPQVPVTPQLANQPYSAPDLRHEPSAHGAEESSPAYSPRSEALERHQSSNGYAGNGHHNNNVMPIINLNGNASGPLIHQETDVLPLPDQPVAQAETAAIAGVSSLSIAEVNDKWELILRRVRTRKDGAKIAALFAGYTIVGIEGTNEQPIVVCQARADFHFNTLQNEGYQETIVWALKITLSIDCNIRLLPPHAHYTHRSSYSPPSSPTPSPEAGPQPLDRPLSERAAPYAPVNGVVPQQQQTPPSADSRYNQHRQQPTAPTSPPTPPVSVSGVSSSDVPARAPVRSDAHDVTTVREAFSPPALIDRTPTTSALPYESAGGPNGHSSQVMPLARNTPVSENTNQSKSSSNGHMNSASHDHGTRRELIEKQVRNNPVILEALRLFKAEIKDIQPK